MATTHVENGVFINGVFCPVATLITVDQANIIYEDGLKMGMDLGDLNKIVDKAMNTPLPPYDLTPFFADCVNKMEKGQANQWLYWMTADPAFFTKWMTSILPRDLSLVSRTANPNQRPNASQSSRKRAAPSTNDDEEIIDVVGDSEDISQKEASSTVNSKRAKNFTINDLLTQHMLSPAIPLRQTSVIVDPTTTTPLDLSVVSKKNVLEPAAPSSTKPS